jgi:hypothetical protein
VFIALPCRPMPGTGKVKDKEKIELVRPCARGTFRVVRQQCSILTHGFNRLWARALNGRPTDDTTHWAMQHDDIVPPACWVDTQIDEMARTGADVMSAVVPIKDRRGLTTTGLRNVQTGENRRLTMTEIMRLPETFGIDDLEHGPDDVLIVNTGLWVCRFTEPWVEPPFFPGFVQLDRLQRHEDGTFSAACLSEDWCFSEWASRVGLKVMATRTTALAHLDDAGKEYRNDHVWGEWETDQGDGPKV